MLVLLTSASDENNVNKLITIVVLHQHLLRMSKSTKAKANKHREPPPSLFLGPPSLNTSHVSLTGTKSGATSQPPNEARFSIPHLQFLRQPLSFPSQLSFGPLHESNDLKTSPSLTRYDGAGDIGTGNNIDDDAQWTEVQNTLKEVEINAASGIHVFGAQHSMALEGLRRAQIEVAKAWARSEADEAIRSANPLNKTTSPQVFGSGSGAMGTGECDGAKEHTFEADVNLARKRREANDKYFQRVNVSVLDVVSRLEEVASSMKAVAQESREIWGGGDLDPECDTENTRTQAFHSQPN